MFCSDRKSRLDRKLAWAVTFVCGLGAAPAIAAPLSFVSVAGVNTGDCSNAAAPCKTLGYAIAQTSAGGEIKALDAGNFGAVSIVKSISLTGVPGALIIRNTVGAAVTVNANAGVVSISGFTINGFGLGTTGISVLRAAQLTIRDCVIKNFVREGVFFRPTVAVKYAIDDTLFAANNVAGVYVDPASTGSTKGALHRVTITGGGSSSYGVLMVDRSELRISESLISNHGGNGVYVQAETTNKIWLSGNTITQNIIGFGADQQPGFVPTAESAGNNFIAGNLTDVDTAPGTLPLNNLGPQ